MSDLNMAIPKDTLEVLRHTATARSVPIDTLIERLIKQGVTTLLLDSTARQTQNRAMINACDELTSARLDAAMLKDDNVSVGIKRYKSDRDMISHIERIVSDAPRVTIETEPALVEWIENVSTALNRSTLFVAYRVMQIGFILLVYRVHKTKPQHAACFDRIHCTGLSADMSQDYIDRMAADGWKLDRDGEHVYLTR
ncbi:MAG: hypothetical protein OXU36_19225 [Candidatus Poribacteria bacterium]|nr:hypothetical protein [Candidatus Poribacteria bacterium]